MGRWENAKREVEMGKGSRKGKKGKGEGKIGGKKGWDIKGD